MHNILILIFINACSHVSHPINYERKNWKHWTDRDGNCLNTRAEILKKHSLTPISLNKKGCSVVTGYWNDYYYPEVHLLAKKVDIDHLIPLKNAHETGGASWSRNKREVFANDPENLVITNRTYNRKKGAKGIDGWLPVNKDYACKYIRDWVKIKTKYKLQITPKEQRTVDTSRCP